MLTTTLAVDPPFFLIETLVDETLMVQFGGPLPPGTPSLETSRQGVLSTTVPPETIDCDLMLAELLMPVVYAIFGRVGC